MWKTKRGSRLAGIVIVSLVLAMALAGLALVPTTTAASPATFHVTLATANEDMSIMGMAFYPDAITLHPGDYIVFTNVLPEPHTVTFGLAGPPANPNAFLKPQNLSGPGAGTYSGSGILNSGWLFPGGPFGNSFTLTVGVGPGSYAYRCALHPRMTGSITVLSADQPLPKTDAQYQRLAHFQMRRDIVRGRPYEIRSIIAAFTASDIGGKGIEVAVGGGNGVSTVMRFFSPRLDDDSEGEFSGGFSEGGGGNGLSNLVIHVGDTVHFVNRDPFTPHTVTFGPEPSGAPNSLHNPYGNPKAFDGSYPLNSGFLQPFLPWGMFFNVTFTHAGTFNYICGLHDTMGMVGTIMVLP